MFVEGPRMVFILGRWQCNSAFLHDYHLIVVVEIVRKRRHYDKLNKEGEFTSIKRNKHLKPH